MMSARTFQGTVDDFIDHAWQWVGWYQLGIRGPLLRPVKWQREATRAWVMGQQEVMIVSAVKSGKSTLLKVLAEIEYGTGKYLLDTGTRSS